MGLWEVGVVGNNYGMDSTRVSRDLVLRNLKNIKFLLIFSIFQWGVQTKSHVFVFLQTINPGTIPIRTASKSECHEPIFRNRVQKSIKRNQPNTFQNMTFIYCLEK